MSAVPSSRPAARGSRLRSCVAGSLVGVLGALGAVGAVGCGGETGIVLEIHKAPGVSSEVNRLDVYVGVGHAPGLFDPAWWLAAELEAGDARVRLDAELGGGTHRYLVRPGGGLDLDTDLVFAVAGYKHDGDSKPVVFGHSTATVRFGDGEVRIYPFPLVTFLDTHHGVTATGCAWWDLEGTRRRRDAIAPHDDADCDAFRRHPDGAADCVLDCDDGDPTINPGAAEICADGIDQNCCDDNDGQDDLDGDGFARCGTATPDCVDLPPGVPGPRNVFGEEVPSNQIFPGAPELCDGLDNDCKDGCDDLAAFDPDGDGYLNCQRVGGDERIGVRRTADACERAALDCLETEVAGGPDPATINPGAADDDCDGWDQDCDGVCDGAMVSRGDEDDDGFPACTTEDGYATASVPRCRLGTGADCDDGSAYHHPGRAERCDGIDFDCDGALFPSTSPCFVTVDEAGIARCRLGTRTCNDTPGDPEAGFGACERDPNALTTHLPQEWCTSSCALAADPIQCLASEGPRCDVHFPMALAGEPCAPPADVALPEDVGAGGCAYALAGGAIQGDWIVRLVDPQGNVGLTATGCGSRLRIQSARVDAEDRVVLVVTAVAPHTFELRRRDQCGSQANVICQ